MNCTLKSRTFLSQIYSSMSFGEPISMLFKKLSCPKQNLNSERVRLNLPNRRTMAAFVMMLKIWAFSLETIGTFFITVTVRDNRIQSCNRNALILENGIIFPAMPIQLIPEKSVGKCHVLILSPCGSCLQHLAQYYQVSILFTGG